MGQTETQIKRRAGRKALLTADHGAVLKSIAHELPRSSLDELTREFNRRCELNVCSATVRKALKQAGITRMRPTRKPAERAAVQGGMPIRTGYAERHRREDGRSGMNTDLTDAAWALVADLFERHGGRGAPATHERRVLVNACCSMSCARAAPGACCPRAFDLVLCVGIVAQFPERNLKENRFFIGPLPLTVRRAKYTSCLKIPIE